MSLASSLLTYTVALAASARGSAAGGVHWGVVIDCGSSGSRARLYTWTDNSSVVDEFTPSAPADEAALQIEPGLSSFAADPDGAGPYLSPLLAQAARWVPAAAHNSTRVQALATAGMRLLPAHAQARVWQAVERAIAQSAFGAAHAAGGAMTLSGEFEGLFNWMTIEYILARDPRAADSPYFGGLDLGGASTQISFRPADGVILQDAYRVRRGEEAYRLYSHSYMRFGQDQAKLRLAQLIYDTRASGAGEGAPLTNPCANTGLNENYTVNCGAPSRPCTRLFVGSGEHSACKELTATLLRLDSECLLAPCAAHGVYQPSVAGVHFFAISAFFYTANGLGLLGWSEEKGISAAEIDQAGAAFCAKPWAEVASRYATSYCFASAYIPMLLRAYGVPYEDQSLITFARKIRGFNSGWTLGAQLFAIAAQRCEVASSACTTPQCEDAKPAPPPPPPPQACPTPTKPTWGWSESTPVWGWIRTGPNWWDFSWGYGAPGYGWIAN